MQSAEAAPTPAPEQAAVETAEAAQDILDEDALVNTAWEAETFGGPGDSIPVIPDTYPSLHFMVGRYSGYTGCNYFLGVYGVDGSTLALDTPAMTEGGCNETALINQDSTYSDLLWNVDSYALVDDKLLLYAVEDQLILTMIALETLPLEGTTWELKFISPEPAYWQPLIAGTMITAHLDGEQLTGDSGCNEYSAPYTLADGQLTLGEITVTDRTCDEPDGVMDQESAYLTMLATAGRLAESSAHDRDADGRWCAPVHVPW